MNGFESIKLTDIEMDPDTQPRAEIDSGLIGEYAADMKAGAVFPPVTIFREDGHLWLADGWHRVLAAKKLGLPEIMAATRPGKKEAAILHAVSANDAHGKRRTREDKSQAVLTMLKDPAWGTWSDRAIARHCRVSNTFVGNLRSSLKPSRPDVTVNVDSEAPPPESPAYAERVKDFFRAYKDRHGTETRMNTAKIGRADAASERKFNRTNDNIGWAAWSWNPVTGCLGGCEYCYARPIAKRFYPDEFAPTFHGDRLRAPANTNPLPEVEGGNRVFVCSMADLFGTWVKDEWIDKVVEQVRANPQWTFLFLTKNPKRYESISFLANAWIGATVDVQARAEETEKAMAKARAKIRFVSCEPLLEKVAFSKPETFDWFLIGAQGKTSRVPAFQPEWPWVLSILKQAESAGKPVFWKDNLNPPRQAPVILSGEVKNHSRDEVRPCGGSSF